MLHPFSISMLSLILIFVLKAYAEPPHLDLQMSGAEYQQFVQQLPSEQKYQIYKNNRSNSTNDPILKAIELGNRNLEWLKVINQKRINNRQKPLSFSDPSTMRGVPIDKPRIYGPQTIENDLLKTLKKMPYAFRKVIESSGKLPDEPTIPIKDYLKWGLEMDFLYQFSIRWQLLIPWKDYLTKQKQQDVRGFYYLEKEPDLENKLRFFSKLNKADQKRLREYLIIVCQNTEGVINDSCDNMVDIMLSYEMAYEFYDYYRPNSQKIWNKFFDLQNPRTDLIWNNSNPLVLIAPFRDPKNPVVESFLRDNIEDEWKFLNWRLVLNFQPNALMNVKFVANENPHVDKLGGDNIVMDAKAPLTEYDVQWTIRHEFGHSLGLPDCYVEFYIPQDNVMMSYQLDTTNLMCSRQGHIKDIHYEQLKKHYYKP